MDGQHQGTTESGEDSDKGSSDSGGILDGIVNWLSGILAKIKELPALIFDAFKTALQTIADKVGKIAGEVYDFFKPFIDFVKTSFKFIKKVLKKLVLRYLMPLAIRWERLLMGFCLYRKL